MFAVTLLPELFRLPSPGHCAAESASRGAMAVPSDLRAAAGRIKYQQRKHASSTGAASQPAVPRGGAALASPPAGLGV